MFCYNFSFRIFSLMFSPLFSKVLTNILKIYELPKVHNKTPEYRQTLVSRRIIYRANSVPQQNLTFELYSS